MLTKRDPSLPASGYAYIPVGQDHYALVDEEDYDRIAAYKWHLRRARGCIYAVRKKITAGREFLIPMHRQIMHTPRDKVTHHINHDTLDNRKANLLNMTPEQHREIHRFG